MTRQITNPLPTPGQAGWDDELNEVLQEVVDNIEQPIAASDIDIQGDLTLNGNALTDVGRIRFSTGLDSSTALTVFVSGSTPEWYLRDGSNNRIQVTAGGFLNVQGSGSIGGDYSNSSAAGIFTNSSGEFAWTSSPGVYANMRFGAHLIHNGSSTGAIKLQAPSGQSSNVTLTLPGALGGDGCVLSVDATGTIAANRNPILSGTIAAGGRFIITGNATVTGHVVGNLTGSQTGSFEVVRGVRDILHDNLFTLMIPAIMGAPSSPAFYNTTGRGIDMSTAGSGSGGAWIGIPLKVGDKIDGFTATYNKGSSSGKASWRLVSLAVDQGVNPVTQRSGDCTTGTAAAIYQLGSSSLNYTIAANETVYLDVTGGGTSGDTLRAVEVRYRRPTGSL
jgi:hypothetical protein